MRRARVLVNTSRTGSVDKVVLEAMASGTIPLTCNESFLSVFDEDLQRDIEVLDVVRVGAVTRSGNQNRWALSVETRDS